MDSLEDPTIPSCLGEVCWSNAEVAPVSWGNLTKGDAPQPRQKCSNQPCSFACQRHPNIDMYHLCGTSVPLSLKLGFESVRGFFLRLRCQERLSKGILYLRPLCSTTKLLRNVLRHVPPAVQRFCECMSYDFSLGCGLRERTCESLRCGCLTAGFVAGSGLS